MSFDRAAASDAFLLMPEAAARERLAAALGRLSPMQRGVVESRLAGQTDMAVIAAALGCSADAARASLAFAIAQLRMSLSEAPQDKTRNEWLRRCQGLLTPAASASGAPPDRQEAVSPVIATVSVASDAAEPSGARSAVVPSRSRKPSVATATGRSGPWIRAMLGLALLGAGFATGLGWSHWHQIDAAEPENEMPIVPGTAVIDAEPAPLTAPDFDLVAFRARHPDVLEHLDFYLWLAEQDALR